MVGAIINQAGHGISTEASLKDCSHAYNRQILDLRRAILGDENNNLKAPIERTTLQTDGKNLKTGTNERGSFRP